MFRSLLTGISIATRSWKMILLLLAANLLLSLPVAVPVFLLIVQTAGERLAAERMLADKLDASWVIDLFNHQFPGASIEAAGAEVGMLLLALGAIHLLLNVMFAGGIIGVYDSEDGRFGMAKFWASAGSYFWRYFRLMLISLIFYALAYIVYYVVDSSIDRASARAEAFDDVVYRRWAAMAALALMFAVVNMIFDYAKIGAAVKNSRGMWRETFKAIGFAFRNFFSTFGLYLIVAIFGLAVFLGLNQSRWAVDQSSGGAVMLAIILSQLAVAARVWNKLTFYAAQLNLYRELNPGAGAIEAPVQPPVDQAASQHPDPRQNEPAPHGDPDHPNREEANDEAN
jgi:hypothetical protein